MRCTLYSHVELSRKCDSKKPCSTQIIRLICSQNIVKITSMTTHDLVLNHQLITTLADAGLRAEERTAAVEAVANTARVSEVLGVKVVAATHHSYIGLGIAIIVCFLFGVSLGVAHVRVPMLFRYVGVDYVTYLLN